MAFVLALHGCKRPRDIAAVVAGEGARALGAASGLLAVREGESLVLAGTDTTVEQALADVLRAPEPKRGVVAGRAFGAVRLVAGDRVLGGVAFEKVSVRGKGKQRLVLLARHCAAALERTLAQEAELAALGTSRQLLRAVTEGTHDCVFVKDLQSRYVMMNSAGARMFGLTPEQVLGKDDMALFDPQNAQEIAQRDRAVMESQRTTMYESSSTIRDGTTRIWQSTKGPWLDEEGRVIGIVGISRDITERRNAEEAQRLLAEVSGVLGYSLEYESNLTAMARVLVPSFAEGCEIHVHEAGELQCLAALGPAAALTEPMLGLMQGRSSLGWADLDEAQRGDLAARGAHSLLIVPIAVPGQAFGYMTLLSRARGRYEILAERTLAEELARRAGLAIDRARLYRAVQGASRLKDEFLGVISHELRTPLTAILGWTSVLRRDSVPAVSRGKALETIERNALAQARLIDDLMDTTSMIAGKLKLEHAEIDLLQTLDLAVEALRPLAAAKGIRLRTDFDTRGPLPIHGDECRLRQVFSNLLGNALKFTQRGGSVEIGFQRGDKVIVWVKDDGAGIAPSTLPHVFERFRQGDSSTTRMHGGLGLGLSIVQHIVEGHGGVVMAESPGKGQGSTFSVELPLRARGTPRAVAFSPDPRTPRLEGVHVLVVEDELDTREFVTGIFMSVGAAVTAVHNVAEAVATLTHRKPQIIVSGLVLPDEEGYALIKRARVEDTPAIALTAHTSAEHRAAR